MNINKKLALLTSALILLTACQSDNNNHSVPIIETQVTTIQTTTEVINTTTPIHTNKPIDKVDKPDKSDTIGAFNDSTYLTKLSYVAKKIEFDIPKVDFSAVDGENNEGNFLINSKYFEPFGEIPSSLRKSVSDDEFEQWFSDISKKSESQKLSDTANCYTFFKHFNITWDDVKYDIEKEIKAFKEKNPDSNNSLTLSDWRAIFTGTENEINETFAYRLALVVEDRTYTPQWLYEHDLADYVDAGITPDQLFGLSERYGEIFGDDFGKGIKRKYNVYRKLCDDFLISYNNGEDYFDAQKWMDKNL